MLIFRYGAYVGFMKFNGFFEGKFLELFPSLKKVRNVTNYQLPIYTGYVDH